jgi:putative ubiquitin-RnfH superfamily antitoxin RatB of RatAB toxin-antitoxin module
MRVTFLHSAQARQITEWELNLPEQTQVAEALQALPTALQQLILSDPQVGAGAGCSELKDGFKCSVWAKPARMDQLLREGDRLEVVRPIKVDPKVARRERFKKQGAKAAGLFAKKRPGAKAGY